MGIYFRIMNASSGGIGIEYLEKQPFAKIVWLSRMAEASNIQKHLDSVYSINTGYSGDQKKLDNLQHRVEFLLLETPKTDTHKLKKYKDMQKAKEKAVKLEKKKKKNRKWVKLDLKDK